MEYFFQVIHSLAKMLSGENQLRQASEMALKSADHILEAAPENCRVAFTLIVPNKNFPVHFPCQDGNEGACQAQCK